MQKKEKEKWPTIILYHAGLLANIYPTQPLTCILLLLPSAFPLICFAYHNNTISSQVRARIPTCSSSCSPQTWELRSVRVARQYYIPYWVKHGLPSSKTDGDPTWSNSIIIKCRLVPPRSCTSSSSFAEKATPPPLTIRPSARFPAVGLLHKFPLLLLIQYSLSSQLEPMYRRMALPGKFIYLARSGYKLFFSFNGKRRWSISNFAIRSWLFLILNMTLLSYRWSPGL